MPFIDITDQLNFVELGDLLANYRNSGFSELCGERLNCGFGNRDFHFV